ncbi:2-amino-4-hydroxy-6-hydroxymethyldihydropteridine diphosphokinase [Enemella evansiae]|uniref:2-amino-4-hydroxy-6-hydroxymethyldihydropteridine diphosphokinase n=1 Tax=Enemella evansiae TaxID=2016499 RepID=A0A255GL83_9ACTN|nr:2-amino-4-hydroxy-6-hydroxymethyldihydropteridine diphosphokinase [Enemella evansiae]PFG65887.1 2-amino-4-hydroxy-6-hydroxymethyldihydropteridine diphosphokinase [Propionibacteriaceae bacterium ES.041]OYN98657.1 2-amino-4-hydroxy-6-hydroxymethyldihydropteridine diphosphokinase [Enemella evansiae]OYN98854.1 2-amino-4-hydroxy-6-hydroxymethyldihydropteridine diphosphokinase [Enemella evansiae]OYO03256.1 2-amino-4-hydroxy-6-hydroxymethyldihydropteridine diphosphokinase [Enemella evansiae]OYO139
MTHPFAVDVDTLSGMRPLSTAVFALGSNLGDRLENLQGALEGLRNTPDVMVVDVSAVYETAAVGGPEDNPDFLNAVVVTETTLQPRTLLERALAIEDAYGRIREEVDGPRTLDVDLLIVGKREIDEKALRLPHPRAHERAFVLVPWHEVDPRASIPGHGAVADLLADLDTSGVRRRDDLVLED